MAACLVGVACLLPAWTPLQAKLIAYEGFDAGAGTENPEICAGFTEGAAVPDGSGFQKLQAAGRGPLVVTAEGLSFENLAVTGRAVAVPDGQSPSLRLYENSTSDPFESLRDPADPSAFGKPGTTLWFSCLMQIVGSAGPESMAAVKIGSNRIHAGLINNQKSAESAFRLISVPTPVVAEPGRTYLLVTRIDYGAKSSPDDKTDRIMFWVDPDVGGDTPGMAPQAMVDNTSAPFSSVWFMRNSLDGLEQVIVDEIRVGETYADVVPAK